MPREKVRDYLLSLSHRDGRAKAAFFMGLGFRQDEPEALESALLDLARTHPVSERRQNTYGISYRVDGPLHADRGSAALVRTVWFIAAGSTIPRLVTAYPVSR